MKRSFVLKLICLILTVCMIAPCVISCNKEEAVDNGNQGTITEEPTSAPTDAPTNAPTEEPTDETTEEPTEKPTDSEETTIEEPTSGEDVTTEENTTEENTTEENTTEENTTEENTTEESTTEENTTEESTTEEKYIIEGLDVDSSKMHGNMQNIFGGDTVFFESVMFINKGETKTLLFPIDEIIEVQSYNGRKKYVEGRDYQIVDGKLYIPETSTINVITSKGYYNYTSSPMIFEKYNGVDVPVYWGENETMTQWQLRVTYKHSKTWYGFKQETYIKQYEGLIKKLIAGEDVTFIFYGDSITCGATSSWFSNVPTLDWYQTKAFFQWSYSMLFTQALADLFGYTIDFIDASTLNTIIKAPPADYVGGTRGTITYINTSVGGWTSEGGLNNFDKHIKPFIEKYGCDLFGVAFGMNDAGVDPVVTANNIKSIYQRAMALDSDFYGMVISTMVPNNEATNGWYGNQYLQEEKLESVVDYLNNNGIKSGLVRVTSVSQALLTRKSFRDHTGNNINHPNDFMHRIYAQTCLQAFLGYENIK